MIKKQQLNNIKRASEPMCAKTLARESVFIHRTIMHPSNGQQSRISNQLVRGNSYARVVFVDKTNPQLVGQTNM